MFSTEQLVKKGSDYYFYTPSVAAKELLLYPTIIGCFTYEAGYSIHRTHFDSFLLMLVEEGVCTVRCGGKERKVARGQLVLVDCYDEHEYGSNTGWSAYWVHFDGPMARRFYAYIAERDHTVVTPADYENIRYMMGHLYRHFRERKPTNESRLSGFLTQILGSMLSAEVKPESQGSAGLQEAITFINEHFAEPLSLQDMAKVASLSPYYFSRLFAKETGVTPHQYLISTRIASAKYQLANSAASIKEIAFRTGFADESSFCSTFRKKEGLTPSAYRSSQT